MHEFFAQLGESARDIERVVLNTENEGQEMDLEMEASAVELLRMFFPHANIRRQYWWKTASVPKFETILSEKGKTCVGLY